MAAELLGTVDLGLIRMAERACLVGRARVRNLRCWSDHTHTPLGSSNMNPSLHLLLCYFTGFKAHSHVIVNLPNPGVKSKGRKASLCRRGTGARPRCWGGAERL